VGRYGTNLEGFGAFEGGVNADKGAPLVSTSSDGETALLFGPAALREIQAGVANGDFAIPPDAAGDTITESNPLPYWTFTDVNSAGAITAAIVADAGAGSGNVLRFTVASGTLTGKSATLTRFVPVASSASRSFSFYAEATFDNGTNSNQAAAQLTCQFYQADQTTTTGTAFSSANALFSALTSSQGLTAPDVFAVSPSLSDTTAPADAAFLKLTITISTLANQSSSRSVDVTEVRIANGSPALILTDKSTPANAPAYIINDGGTLSLGDGGGLGALDVGNNSLLNGTDSVSFQATDIEALGDFRVTGYSNLEGSDLSQVAVIGSASNTSLGAAGTFVALERTSGFLEVSFTPQFVGQRWLFLFTGYSSLNTSTRQYSLIRADVRDSSDNVIVSPWAYTRAEGITTSGVGATVAISKVWIADRTSDCKFKLYGTAQTTGGLIISVSYVALTAYPIG